MLQEIASSGNGIYVRASNSRLGLEEVIKEVNKLEKTEFDTKIYTDYEDRFQYFIAAALVLLLLEFLISERKSRWLSEINFFEIKK